MKVFFDTNILIDFLAEREPFVDDAALILGMCEQKEISGCFTALSACNIVYVLRKSFDGGELRNRVTELSEILEMIDTRSVEVKAALTSGDSDFEDAVQRICAEENSVDVIITRDKTGFASKKISVMNPTEFIDKIEAGCPGFHFVNTNQGEKANEQTA
ncbi:MAG: PIN domain-containing protein [Kiritimatiellae bacterium]|nr:PIN domain-containing protein [Kiritimatiellia bacterium]